MRNLIFPLAIFFIIKSNVHANRNAFTSPSCFSMGGAGSLFLSANAQIKNPAVLNKSRSITTSIVKYPAMISGQRIRLRNQGIGGGDLYLKITITPHGFYQLQQHVGKALRVL